MSNPTTSARVREAMTVETGGPAFPTESKAQTGPSTCRYEGMTLRDYFAAKAMTVISKPTFYVGDGETKESLKAWGKAVYELADAMLAERGKT